MFRCANCSNFFETADHFTAHNSNWCRTQHQNAELEQQKSSKLFAESDRSVNSTDRAMSERDRREEMTQHLAQLEGLSTNCADCAKITFDFRAHLTKHSSAAATSQPNISDENVDNAAPAEATPTEATPVRMTRQRLETIGRQAASLTDSRPGSVVEVRPAPEEVARESPKIDKKLERRPSRCQCYKTFFLRH